MSLRSHRERDLERNVTSTALAIEALELLLIEKGIFKDDELMNRLTRLLSEKQKALEMAVVGPPQTGPVMLDLGD